jgi:hypothetical protein
VRSAVTGSFCTTAYRALHVGPAVIQRRLAQQRIVQPTSEATREPPLEFTILILPIFT